MKTLVVNLRTVGKKDDWKEEWAGRSVQELEEGDEGTHVNRIIAEWNLDHPDNQREVISFELKTLERKLHLCNECGVEYECEVEDCPLPEDYTCGDCKHKIEAGNARR